MSSVPKDVDGRVKWKEWMDVAYDSLVATKQAADKEDSMKPKV